MARILVVDDDPDITEACQLVLQQAGHEVAVAQSAEAGLALVESFGPDLVVLDVIMHEPDDGIAMAQELRRRQFEKPIIMLSSICKVTGMEYDRDNSMIPVDEFIEKPVSPTTFVEKVNNLLGGKEGD